jgi:hypothetical protein
MDALDLAALAVEFGAEAAPRIVAKVRNTVESGLREYRRLEAQLAKLQKSAAGPSQNLALLVRLHPWSPARRAESQAVAIRRARLRETLTQRAAQRREHQLMARVSDGAKFPTVDD